LKGEIKIGKYLVVAQRIRLSCETSHYLNLKDILIEARFSQRAFFMYNRNKIIK